MCWLFADNGLLSPARKPMRAAKSSLFDVCCSLRVACCVLLVFVVCCSLVVVCCCALCDGGCRLFVVCCSLCVVRCLLFVAPCPMVVVCYSL